MRRLGLDPKDLPKVVAILATVFMCVSLSEGW
jgi:hypothetical protein